MTLEDLGIDLEDNTDCTFNEPKVSLNSIINLPIQVLGCQKDVQTKNGLRYLVKFKHSEGVNVFFTDSKYIKSILDHPKIAFPFETTIKSIRVGQFQSFKFT